MSRSTFPTRIQTKLAGRRSDYGSSYVRQEDGVTYSALVRNLDPKDDPGYFAEAGLNPEDDRAILLDDMDPTNPTTFGDHLTWPATGNASTDRWLVVGVPDPAIRKNVSVKKVAVATYAPDKS